MVIELKLEEQSINKAIAELQEYINEIEKKVNRATKELAELGERTAKQNVAVETGALASSIHVNGSNGEYEIVCNGRTTHPHAAFVEFGTGVVGASNSYPYSFPEGVSWAYDVNGHGKDGWTYIGQDSQQHWTMGMPARPFMAPAASTMRSNVLSVYRKAFK